MKRIKCVAALLLFAVILGGCCKSQDEGMIIEHKPEAEKGEKIELSFYGFKEGSWNVIAIENAMHGFMDLYPNVNITYEGIEGTEYWDILEKRVKTGNMDDIIMVDHDRIISLAAEHRLADLSDLSTIENYNDMAKSQFPEDGPLYFLPTCISTYGLYINRDMLKEHGQEVPADLGEFATVCDYFVSQGITPIIGNNYATLRCLMAAKGLYPVYQTENPTEEIQKINRGETDLAELLKPGVDLVSMMIEKEWFDPQEVLETSETWGDMNAFAKGDRPFMVTGGWVSISLGAMDLEFDYGVYPFPILEDGSVLVQDVNTCISVNADSENAEMAKKFVEYLTQPDVMWVYCNSQSSFTPLTDERILSDPALRPSVSYLTNGQSVIGSDYNLELPIDRALYECGTKMLEGMEADTAAEYLSELLLQIGY